VNFAILYSLMFIRRTFNDTQLNNTDLSSCARFRLVKMPPVLWFRAGCCRNVCVKVADANTKSSGFALW